MTGEELAGFLMMVGVVGALGLLVSLTRLPHTLKLLIYVALALRVVGSVARYGILQGVYGGRGDAVRYHDYGLEYAARFMQFDFSPFYDPTLWGRSQWWGTPFVYFPSGISLTAIGPSFLGQFVFFSLLSFIGLAGFALAFRRAYPDVPLTNYARWIWLFPSLWFWPSSVGKEAIVLMGLGLAVAGFIGSRERINWLLLSVGVFFVFAIRPQMAAVVILSFVVAHWLSLGTRWTARRVGQGALILAAGLGGIWLSMNFIGVGGFDAEGVQEYMEAESQGAAIGGSAIDNVGVGLAGIPLAMVNILARPFPWEAHNLMALFSALEIAAFWAIIWYRRRNVMEALRTWRSHALLRLAIPFVLLYAITLGMLIVNLGIIARQRIFLFPFLFILLEAAPAVARRKKRKPDHPWVGPVQREPERPVPAGGAVR